MKRKRLQKKIQDAKSPKVETKDPLLQVFSNDSILNHLEKFLLLADLKNLRLVNRHFNSNIILRTSFTSRIFFTVNEELISSRTLEKIGFPIKTARIHCFRPDSSWIHVCKNGCFKELYDLGYISEGEEVLYASRMRQTSSSPSKTWYWEEIEHIYKALKHVEDLSVYCPDRVFTCSCLCDAKDESVFPLFPSVNRIIHDSRNKLKELKLNSKWVKHVLGDYAGILGYRLKKLEHLHVYSRCTQLPESLMALKNLKTIEIVDCEYSSESDFPIINGLVAGNAKSLQSLSISGSFLSNDEQLNCLKSIFAQLNHFHIKFFEPDSPQLIEFLQEQAARLETLELEYLALQEPLPEELLSILPTLPNLRKLYITANTGLRSMEHIASLQNCIRLEHLQVKARRFFVANEVSGIEIPQMFNYVPASARSLSLYGYTAYRGPALSEAGIRAVPNLTALELSDCYAAVTNETLQAIFDNCTMLKELVLTHARRCNNEGFLGNGSSESTAISNLTRLEKLILQDCNLTDVVVFKAFRFPRLMHLDITQNQALTNSLRLEYLLNRNPSLEVLRLNKFHGIHRREDLTQLRKMFPGLRLLQVKPNAFMNPEYVKYVTL